VNDLSRTLVSHSYPSPSVGSIKVTSGGVTEMHWGTIMHEPHVSLNIQWDSSQKLWKTVLQKTLLSSDISVYEIKRMALRNSHVPVANATGTATVHRKLAISSWTPHVRQLVFDERWFGDPPLRALARTLLHLQWSTASERTAQISLIR
jgi:hypothetical protein